MSTADVPQTGCPYCTVVLPALDTNRYRVDGVYLWALASWDVQVSGVACHTPGYMALYPLRACTLDVQAGGPALVMAAHPKQ
jgi:hypothetical protein